MCRTVQRFYIGQQSDGIDIAQKWFATGDISYMETLLKNQSFPEIMWYNTGIDHQKYAKPESMFILPQVLSIVDSERLSDIYAVLNSYKDQAFVEFITGVRNIDSDSDWNAYLSDLDRLNSREVLAIRQKYLR